MTIGGALSELNNLLKADDIPVYYKPSIKAVVDTIVLSRSENPNKWIPVSERLPDKNGQYLVTTTSAWGTPLVIIRSFAQNLKKIDQYDFFHAKGCGWYDYDSEVGYWRDKGVKAWMEFHFPEPYKSSPTGAEGGEE